VCHDFFSFSFFWGALGGTNKTKKKKKKPPIAEQGEQRRANRNQVNNTVYCHDFQR
jgi:hypothetical protein